MALRRRLLRTGLLAVTFLLLAACAHDWGWGARLEAWIDETENGVQDAGEQPLAGVACSVEFEPSGHISGYASAVADEEGKARLSLFVAACFEETRFTVVAASPAGYRPTTPLRHSSTLDRAAGVVEASFGFGSVPDQE